VAPVSERKASTSPLAVSPVPTISPLLPMAFALAVEPPGSAVIVTPAVPVAVGSQQKASVQPHGSCRRPDPWHSCRRHGFWGLPCPTGFAARWRPLSTGTTRARFDR
jgi:hypothetical protein